MLFLHIFFYFSFHHVVFTIFRKEINIHIINKKYQSFKFFFLKCYIIYKDEYFLKYKLREPQGNVSGIFPRYNNQEVTIILFLFQQKVGKKH